MENIQRLKATIYIPVTNTYKAAVRTTFTTDGQLISYEIAGIEGLGQEEIKMLIGLTYGSETAYYLEEELNYLPIRILLAAKVPYGSVKQRFPNLNIPKFMMGVVEALSPFNLLSENMEDMPEETAMFFDSLLYAGRSEFARPDNPPHFSYYDALRIITSNIPISKHYSNHEVAMAAFKYMYNRMAKLKLFVIKTIKPPNSILPDYKLEIQLQKDILLYALKNSTYPAFNISEEYKAEIMKEAAKKLPINNDTCIDALDEYFRLIKSDDILPGIKKVLIEQLSPTNQSYKINTEADLLYAAKKLEEIAQAPLQDHETASLSLQLCAINKICSFYKKPYEPHANCHKMVCLDVKCTETPCIYYDELIAIFFRLLFSIKNTSLMRHTYISFHNAILNKKMFWHTVKEQLKITTDEWQISRLEYVMCNATDNHSNEISLFQ